MCINYKQPLDINMPKLILTIGISNSKKSTYAREYLKRNPNAIELSRDNIRYSTIIPDSWKDEDKISNIIYNKTLEAMYLQKDIIISDTNLSPTARYLWSYVANEYGYELEYVVFNTAFNNTFYSNSSKLHNLPDHVLTNQYNKFVQFLEEALNPAINYKFI